MTDHPAADLHGPQQAVGNVLLGLGIVATMVALLLMALGQSLRFIDAPTMAWFGAAMGAVGWWQRSSKH